MDNSTTGQPMSTQKPQGAEVPIDIGMMEHRGNTVNYVYDKCRLYGDQLGWRFQQIDKVLKILNEDWNGGPEQAEASRRNEEYNAMQAQITSLEAMLEEKEKRIEALEAAVKKHPDLWNQGGYCMAECAVICEALAASAKGG